MLVPLLRCEGHAHTTLIKAPKFCDRPKMHIIATDIAGRYATQKHCNLLFHDPV